MVAENMPTKCECECDHLYFSESITFAQTGIDIPENGCPISMTMFGKLFTGSVPPDPSRWLRIPVARWFYRRWRKKHARDITTTPVTHEVFEGNCTWSNGFTIS